MANQLKIALFLLVAMLSGCTSTLDFSGFFFPDNLVDSRFVQSEQWNQTHPFKNLVVTSENYQLLVAADSHIGPLVNFNKFLTEASKLENTAFVMVGDIVSGHKEDYLVFKNALPDFNLVHYFLMAGNHDLYFDGWKSFYEDFGSSTYYFTVQTPTQSDLYICLDSGSGTLGSKQLAWLKNVLSTKRANYRNCVVFSHVNFFRNRHTGSTNPLVDELYVLMDLFAENRVNMVISGHDHVRSINNFGFTTYITLGGLLDLNPNASYLKLKVTSTKADYEFVDLKSL
jgi:UDP-2,3-diacylglucosamine pyrophosphatase LpxH